MTKKKRPEDLLKRGVKPIYCEKLAQRVLDLVSTRAQGLKSLKREFPDIPCDVVVYEWCHKYPDFASLYAQAKIKQAELLAAETLEIADNASNDWMESNDPDNPGYKFNAENCQRSRLRIDTRKWLASKLIPRLRLFLLNEY